MIESLILTPRTARDSVWEGRFNTEIWKTSLLTTHAVPFTGPDGYPYLGYTLSRRDGDGIRFVEALRTAMQSTCGIAVLFEAAQEPAHVFSHGDVVACERFGAVNTTLKTASEGGAFADGRPVVRFSGGRLLGPPSETFLPPSTGRAMEFFAKRFGIPDPRISVLFEPNAGLHVAFNLYDAWALEKNESALRLALSQLAWFLPRCYQLCVEPRDVPRLI